MDANEIFRIIEDWSGKPQATVGQLMGSLRDLVKSTSSSTSSSSTSSSSSSSSTSTSTTPSLPNMGELEEVARIISIFLFDRFLSDLHQRLFAYMWLYALVEKGASGAGALLYEVYVSLKVREDTTVEQFFILFLISNSIHKISDTFLKEAGPKIKEMDLVNVERSLLSLRDCYSFGDIAREEQKQSLAGLDASLVSPVLFVDSKSDSAREVSVKEFVQFERLQPSFVRPEPLPCPIAPEELCWVHATGFPHGLQWLPTHATSSASKRDGMFMFSMQQMHDAESDSSGTATGHLGREDGEKSSSSSPSSSAATPPVQSLHATATSGRPLEPVDAMEPKTVAKWVREAASQAIPIDLRDLLLAQLRPATTMENRGPYSPWSKEVARAIGILTQEELEVIVRNNTDLASSLLPHLIACFPEADYYGMFLKLPLTHYTLDMVRKLTLYPGFSYPKEKLHLFISHCIRVTEATKEAYFQHRLVRLVCFFIHALLQGQAIRPQDIIIEVQPFCVEFSRINAASGLYRSLAASVGSGR